MKEELEHTKLFLKHKPFFRKLFSKDTDNSDLLQNASPPELQAVGIFLHEIANGRIPLLRGSPEIIGSHYLSLLQSGFEASADPPQLLHKLEEVQPVIRELLRPLFFKERPQYAR